MLVPAACPATGATNAATVATKTPSAMRRDTCSPQNVAVSTDKVRPSGKQFLVVKRESSAEREGNYVRITELRTDLAVAVDDVLQRGELPQAHRAPGVQLLGRDADLGAETE